MERLQISTRGSPGRCAYCKDDVEIAERAACAACLAVHHRDCWETDACCASCGQSEVLLRHEGLIEPTRTHDSPPAEEWLTIQPLLTEARSARVKMNWRRFPLIVLGFVAAVVAVFVLALLLNL